MADLPPFTKCENAMPPKGYRAQYECISYLARTIGNYDNGPDDKGRFWHAEVKVPEGSEFAEFDFAITLPNELARRFRIQNMKRVATVLDNKAGNLYSLTFYGTSSYGNCQAGPENCVIQNGFKATLFYK